MILNCIKRLFYPFIATSSIQTNNKPPFGKFSLFYDTVSNNKSKPMPLSEFNLPVLNSLKTALFGLLKIFAYLLKIYQK